MRELVPHELAVLTGGMLQRRLRRPQVAPDHRVPVPEPRVDVRRHVERVRIARRHRLVLARDLQRLPLAARHVVRVNEIVHRAGMIRIAAVDAAAGSPRRGPHARGRWCRRASSPGAPARRTPPLPDRRERRRTPLPSPAPSAECAASSPTTLARGRTLQPRPRTAARAPSAAAVPSPSARRPSPARRASSDGRVGHSGWNSVIAIPQCAIAHRGSVVATCSNRFPRLRIGHVVQEGDRAIELGPGRGGAADGKIDGAQVVTGMRLNRLRAGAADESQHQKQRRSAHGPAQLRGRGPRIGVPSPPPSHVRPRRSPRRRRPRASRPGTTSSRGDPRRSETSGTPPGHQAPGTAAAIAAARPARRTRRSRRCAAPETSRRIDIATSSSVTRGIAAISPLRTTRSSAPVVVEQPVLQHARRQSPRAARPRSPRGGHGSFSSLRCAISADAGSPRDGFMRMSSGPAPL